MLQVTTENQARADERLAILLDIPAKHKGFMAAPLIGPVDAERYLATGQFEQVLCGGENYDGARPCHYEWAKGLSEGIWRKEAGMSGYADGREAARLFRSIH
jgi:protein gp37